MTWARAKIRSPALFNLAANLLFVCTEHTDLLSPDEHVSFFLKCVFSITNVKFMRAELCLAWTLPINVSEAHSSSETFM